MSLGNLLQHLVSHIQLFSQRCLFTFWHFGDRVRTNLIIIQDAAQHLLCMLLHHAHLGTNVVQISKLQIILLFTKLYHINRIFLDHGDRVLHLCKRVENCLHGLQPLCIPQCSLCLLSLMVQFCQSTIHLSIPRDFTHELECQQNTNNRCHELRIDKVGVSLHSPKIPHKSRCCDQTTQEYPSHLRESVRISHRKQNHKHSRYQLSQRNHPVCHGPSLASFTMFNIPHQHATSRTLHH
mmetsp:Transcript_1915/g.3911  ORF Transcript_1915/g.3911 Transcript_1915/m.3911 type:complete len:238 (+) Transcript_1915:2453-3166(+)